MSCILSDRDFVGQKGAQKAEIHFLFAPNSYLVFSCVIFFVATFWFGRTNHVLLVPCFGLDIQVKRFLSQLKAPVGGPFTLWDGKAKFPEIAAPEKPWWGVFGFLHEKSGESNDSRVCWYSNKGCNHGLKVMRNGLPQVQKPLSWDKRFSLLFCVAKTCCRLFMNLQKRGHPFLLGNDPPFVLGQKESLGIYTLAQGRWTVISLWNPTAQPTDGRHPEIASL